MRFVVGCTLLRGVLAVAEPLDENGQVLAAARWAQDRAAEDNARVLWNADADPRRPRHERMRTTAENIAWARKILAHV